MKNESFTDFQIETRKIVRVGGKTFLTARSAVAEIIWKEQYVWPAWRGKLVYDGKSHLEKYAKRLEDNFVKAGVKRA